MASSGSEISDHHKNVHIIEDHPRKIQPRFLSNSSLVSEKEMFKTFKWWRPCPYLFL